MYEGRLTEHRAPFGSGDTKVKVLELYKLNYSSASGSYIDSDWIDPVSINNKKHLDNWINKNEEIVCNFDECIKILKTLR